MCRPKFFFSRYLTSLRTSFQLYRWSRSYLLVWPLRASSDLVISAWTDISPNHGVLEQLVGFEDSLFGTMSINVFADDSLDERKSIDKTNGPVRKRWNRKCFTTFYACFSAIDKLWRIKRMSNRELIRRHFSSYLFGFFGVLLCLSVPPVRKQDFWINVELQILASKLSGHW